MSTADWFSASIATTAGAGDMTLMAAAADRRIYVHRMVIIVGTGGNVIRLWSGPSASGTALTGAIVGAQSGVYVFEAMVTTADNLALVLNQQNAVAASGHVCGWYF